MGTLQADKSASGRGSWPNCCKGGRKLCSRNFTGSMTFESTPKKQLHLRVHTFGTFRYRNKIYVTMGKYLVPLTEWLVNISKFGFLHLGNKDTLAKLRRNITP